MNEKENKKKLVFVALSGGVDSSVAALLLKKAGFKVVGVFMRNWSEEISQGSCTYKQDENDARLVAQQLNIPFYVFNFEKEYKKEVVDYLIKGYSQGITPNPDIMCNKYIKFGFFLKKALSLGANYIATGHYARRDIFFNFKNKKFEYKLLKAKDDFKDQTYFLYNLNQEILSKTFFPIGDYLKKEVREIAKKNGLITASKKDSQGICFVGKIQMKDFLKKYITPLPGAIIDINGNLVGKHIGFPFYTIGQREGLAITDGKGPYYIAKKDILKNALIVVNDKKSPLLYSREILASEINWISGYEPKFPIKCKVRVRHQGKLVDAEINKIMQKNKNCVKIITNQKIWAPASGQAVVFYKKDEILGGGIII